MGAQADGTALWRNGFDCVAHQVGEQLPQLSGQGENGAVKIDLFGESDASRLNLSIIQGDDAVENVSDIYRHGLGGFTLEREHLLGHLCDAIEFPCGHGDVFFQRIVFRVLSDEIKEVANGIERVVYLVGDGGSESSGGGQTLADSQGSFGLALFRDIVEHQHHTFDLAFFAPMGAPLSSIGVSAPSR